jgi:hypothetical protein
MVGTGIHSFAKLRASIANSGQMFSVRLREKFGRWQKNSAAHTLFYTGWFY